MTDEDKHWRKWNPRVISALTWLATVFVAGFVFRSELIGSSKVHADSG